MAKIVKPLNPLIFKVAGSMAAEWYEIGRSQGLKSKWPNARAYAKNNLEKFVPKAISILLDMLSNPSYNDVMKMEIYEALTDPINDKDLMSGQEQLDRINAKKLDDIVKEHERYNKDKIGNVVTDNVLINKTNPFTPKAN